MPTTPPTPRPMGSLALVAVLFFLSGFAALVYEIVWMRQLTLALGNTTFSIAVILASFMGGIALGNLAFGRIADRLSRPLLAFGLLELAIGLTGLVLLAAFVLLGPLYRWFVAALDLSFNDGLALALKPVVALLLLTSQTVFMGGTLPVLSRHFIRQKAAIGSGIGFLYAVNTAGAVLGCFCAGFVLLPAWGANMTIGLVIAINLTIGIVAYQLGRAAPELSLDRPDTPVPADAPKPSSTPAPDRSRLFLVAYFLTGLTAIGYEVLWTRQLVFLLGNGAYAFTTMLTTFLLGLSLGGYLYARRFDDVRHPFALFGAIQLAIGLSALLGIALFYRLSYINGLLRLVTGAASWSGQTLIMGLLSLAMMLLPTLLLGMAFPLVNRLYVNAVTVLGRGVALLTACNGLGGICGSFVAGFLLLPVLGVDLGIASVAALNLALGVWILAANSGSKRWTAVLATSAAATVIFALITTASLPPALVVGASSKRRGVIYHRETKDATLSVLTARSGNRMLSINGAVTAADTFTDVIVHKMLAHRGLAIHPQPKDVLVVGFGLGITANSATQYREVTRVDIIELIEDERHTAEFFSHYNQNILQHPHVRLLIGDGRDYIGTTSQQYDVISFNAIHPRLGAALYTEDFYSLCKGKLKPGGLVVGWMPTNWMSPDEFRSLLRTFQYVFPNSTLWYVNPAHLVIVGGEAPVLLDYDLVARRLAQETVGNDLRQSYVTSADGFFRTFLMGPGGLRQYSEGASRNTDNHGMVEYSRAARADIQDGILESLIEAREPVSRYLRVSGDAKELREHLEIAAEAYRDFYFAELFHWKYELDDLARARITRALELVPDDPYVRFISLGFGAPTPPGFEHVSAPTPTPAALLFTTDPDEDPTRHFDAGIRHLRSGDLPEAVGELEYAAVLRPDYVAAYNNLGYAYFLLGEHDQALDNLKTSVSLRPTGWLPHYHAGNIQVARGETTAAIGSFQAAVARNPYHLKALEQLAKLYVDQGESQLAAATRAQARAVSPALD